MPSHSTQDLLPDPPRLDALVDARAREHPDRPALHVDGRFVSYAELTARKARVLKTLLDEGLHDAHRAIGLCCPKSADAYAAMLAIMGSGNVYVPINPSHPVERIRKIAESAGITTFIVDAESLPSVADWVDGHATVIVLNAASRSPTSPAKRAPLRAIPLANADADAPVVSHTCDLAYLMFTSGSTGVPKGVPITHSNALALLEGLRPVLALQDSDRLTHFAELSFDFSVGEIFPCWDAGACLYLPSREDLLDPASFVRRHALTVWSSVPTLAVYVQQLHVLASATMPTLRLSLFCGEALPTGLARFWHEAAPAARIVNLYGPTEATVFSTSYTFDPLDPPPGAWVPIGQPFDTVLARIDATCASGSLVGELLLSGPQVVDRYWGPQVDQSRHFVVDTRTDGRRWYRTGDLVSHDPQHGYVFHGRTDHQVKVRGFRIELQEIEAALRRWLPDQQIAVVAACGDCEQEAELVAFCNRLSVDADELARLCALDLPSYMVPHVFVPLSSFPVNVNGKIDYLSLRLAASATLSESAPIPAK